MLIAAKERGMSLVEAMIALVIAAILMATAMPMYSTWIQNTQIRTGTEAVLNGLQLARSEALNRNINVQFQVAPGGGTGTDWQVTVVDSGAVIQTRSAGSGSASATATPTPASTTTVTFNQLGRVVSPTNNDGTVPLTAIDVTSSVSGFTGARPLRVTISSGGQIRMCDPSAASPDSRAC